MTKNVGRPTSPRSDDAATLAAIQSQAGQLRAGAGAAGRAGCGTRAGRASIARKKHSGLEYDKSDDDPLQIMG